MNNNEKTFGVTVSNPDGSKVISSEIQALNPVDAIQNWIKASAINPASVTIVRERDIGNGRFTEIDVNGKRLALFAAPLF